MVRLLILLVGCLVFVGLALFATGPLVAATPHVPTPVLSPTRVVVAPTGTSVSRVEPTPSPLVSSTPPPVITTGIAPSSPLVPTPVAPENLDSPELRAVWVDAFHDGFKTPQQVDDLVLWARTANLNALFVQVRRRGDAYYLKSFEPRSEDPDLTPGFDALQYLIDRAHSGPQRLQVHAWLATLPIWGQRDTAPLAPNHAFNMHGLWADDTWLMYRDDGSAWAGRADSGMYYLDPGNPAVQAYTTDVYLNVLRNYDVDGIHLDQVRYYEGDALRWGYNPISVALFNERYGRDPSSQPEPSDSDWTAWRRDQVTNLVRRIYLQAKALKPSAAVTAAVVTWGKGPLTGADWETQAPYASVLQDWRSWLQLGIVDYVLPMDYYREGGAQASWFDNWTQWQVTYGGKRNVVLGLGSYLNNADGAIAQLGRARALSPLGVALYSYAVPTADLEGASSADRLAFAAQLRGIFARPARVPELPTSLVAAPAP